MNEVTQMRIGEGTIEEIKDDNLAKVRISRDHLQVACRACFGAERVFVLAKNPIAARAGQDVRYEVAESPLAMGAFMCFIVPLIFLIIGASAGYTFGHENTGLSIAGAVIGLVVSAVIVRTYDTALGRRVDTQATITDVIVPESEDGTAAPSPAKA